MKKLSTSSNAMLESMTNICDLVKDFQDWEDNLHIVKKSIKKVSIFFGCNAKESVVISLLTMAHFKEDVPSASNLIELMRLSFSAIANIHSNLAFFVEKDWIQPEHDILLHPGCRYMFKPRFLKAINTEDPQLLEVIPIATQEDLLRRIEAKMKARTSKHITYEQLVNWCKEMLSSFPNFPVHQVLKQENLSDEEFVFIYYMMSCLIKNVTTVDYEQVISDIRPPLSINFRMQQIACSDKSSLLNNGLIEPQPSLFGGDNYFKLSYKVLYSLIGDDAKQQQKFESSIITLMKPDSMMEKKLIYTPTVMKQMEKIDRLLSPEFHKKCEERMVMQGMTKGISVMLHGFPGTGKTESVKQLALKHNREVMLVEVAEIKNKYVGESEKRIKQVFSTYRDYYKKSTQAPILLFNEADALFGKRRAVVSHLDQYENTMQNILLQELENFEGIFIATTNMLLNIDDAFDRRFLYKVAFDRPGTEVVLALWENKFPGLNEELIQRLSKQWILTGGQLENIRKRYDIESLLDPDLELNWEYLSSQCEQENSMKNSLGTERTPIGFRLAS